MQKRITTKKLLLFAMVNLFFFTTLLSPLIVSAHVVVRPKEVGVAAFQTFTTGAPNEKDVATTQIRLLIPPGLNYVSPNVKPGWHIEVKKEGEGENERVTEIIWSGGEIPVGQRDDFLFSAQVPKEEGTLQWHAYQTYANGEIVAWVESPHAAPKNEDEDHFPYSETMIVNDIANSTTETRPNSTKNLAFPLSAVSLAISLVTAGIVLTRRKKK